MANYLAKDDNLVNNPTPRVAICLCLDLSGSMNTVEGGNFVSTGKTFISDGQTYNLVEGGMTRLNELQKGLNLFFESIRNDEMAVDAAEIAIVGFSSTARKLLDFDHIDNQTVPTLSAEGYTAMGEGVNMALQMLENRKQLYKDNGVQYYQPWLVIMTDGENNGDAQAFQRAENTIRQLVNDKKLTVFAVAIGAEADVATLSRLTPNRRPLRLQGLKFNEFFTWLSKSVSRTSASTPGESVPLPPHDDWGTL